MTGWAPTSDTIPFCVNSCNNGTKYGAPTMVASTPASGASSGNANDDALTKLMNKEVDAMWVYADQARNYNCTYSLSKGIVPSWNCTLWAGFGTQFAYVATGLNGHAQNGTTLTMSRKGSGIPEIINPCIQKYMESEDYFKVCKQFGVAGHCYPNKYFDAHYAETHMYPWDYDTKSQPSSGGCSSGYCQCNGLA